MVVEREDSSYKRMNPKNDFIFQRLFGSEESKDSLIGLLNAILRLEGSRRIESICIIDNKELVKVMKEDKTGRLDIRAETIDRVQFNIEMQLTDQKNMALRTLFYLCKMYTESIKSGEDFAQLKKTVTINLLEFNLFDQGAFHRTFHMYDDQDKELMLTDALEVHFLEFPKFEKRQKNIHDPLHRWLMYLDNRLPEHQLKELMELDPIIQKTEQVLIKLSSDEEARRIYEAREHSRYERNTLINEGIRRGQTEGRAAGIAEGKAVMARELLELGVEVSVIAKASGLTESEIESLLQK